MSNKNVKLFIIFLIIAYSILIFVMLALDDILDEKKYDEVSNYISGIELFILFTFLIEVSLLSYGQGLKVIPLDLLLFFLFGGRVGLALNCLPLRFYFLLLLQTASPNRLRKCAAWCCADCLHFLITARLTWLLLLLHPNQLYFRDKWLLFDTLIIVISIVLVVLDIVLDFGVAASKISGLIRALFRFIRIFLLIRKVGIRTLASISLLSLSRSPTISHVLSHSPTFSQPSVFFLRPLDHSKISGRKNFQLPQKSVKPQGTLHCVLYT